MPWNEFRTHIGYLAARQQKRVSDAFELGRKMHDGQKRRSGEPYFNHPIAVARMLTQMGADADTVIAALLHDTVEDTTLTLPEIEEEFGKTVHDLIEGVTKLSRADIGEAPNLDEQIETLRKIFTLMGSDIRIMAIKLVDRLHNMQTAEFLPEEKRIALAQETIDVYVKIADRLCMQDLRDELEALCLGILKPELFERLMQLKTQNETKGQEILQPMRERLNNRFPEHRTSVQMHFEHKSWENLQEQLSGEGTAITGVSGINLIFVCDNLDLCYSVMGALHQEWKRELMSFQDFINAPAINGYRGLHTTMILEDGTRVRCKIRTTEMHAYARKGVALHCFGKPLGLQEYLPWAERISSLAKDTEGHSSAFWQSLQSDILGESIVIHGPADQSILVPKSSTALDGAFYLFREEALKLTSISIGGKNVPFSTSLGHSHSINVTAGEELTVNREWLNWTKTGFATAMIRSALATGKTGEEKILLGKELLQRVFTDRKKGFLDEFNEQSLKEDLTLLGYPNLDALYTAIADGRMGPADAYDRLFSRPARHQNGKESYFRLSCTIDTTHIDVLDRVNTIYQKFRTGLESMHLKHFPPTHSVIVLQGRLTAADQNGLVSELSAAGAKNIQVSKAFSRLSHLVGIVLLITLWGLDPVFAQQLLGTLSVVDLTILRFFTIWISSAALYTVQSVIMQQRLKPLPFHKDLLSGGLALFVTALATYTTLTIIPPTQYILFIIGGVVVNGVLRRHTHEWHALVMLGLLVLTIGALGATQWWSLTGCIMAAVSSAGFALYSSVSRHYQDEVGLIRVRYPAFLLWISTIGFALSLALLPFADFSALPGRTLLLAVLFSLTFNLLPYILYFEFMRRVTTALLDRALPFVCMATLLGEMLVSRSFDVLLALPFALATLWMYLRPEKKASA